MRQFHLLGAFLGVLAAPASATTWDEPWHEDVVRNAESFVKVDVLESDHGGFTARVVKHLAGAETPEEIRVGGNLMDPRIGTHFPGSVRKALEQLIEDWEAE